MIYDVLDIARYVVNYCNDHNYDITNLKLQKILYFIQANFLVNKGITEPCYNERIEAWSFGPVVPEVYHEFKMYGNSQIPPIDRYFSLNRTNVLNSFTKMYEKPFVNELDERLADKMIEDCSALSASQLVDITHKQRPWKAVYTSNMNNVITKESIFDYFVED